MIFYLCKYPPPPALYFTKCLYGHLLKTVTEVGISINEKGLISAYVWCFEVNDPDTIFKHDMKTIQRDFSFVIKFRCTNIFIICSIACVFILMVHDAYINICMWILQVVITIPAPPYNMIKKGLSGAFIWRYFTIHNV